MSSDLVIVLVGALLFTGTIVALVIAYSRQSGRRRAAAAAPNSASRKSDAHH